MGPELEARLLTHFPNASIELIDESHLHAGHAGARAGGAHFKLKIVHARFNGLARVARHRLVYDAVADWMPQRLHALSVQ
ncbi:MAG: BolA/IbaG family iron-sulfur metabolism protein, partial [Betaproteobacteria bacterium]|nr:BolA/IbaG family iron-sulfur metabolism protein [Betaproteobacteria bacterium]